MATSPDKQQPVKEMVKEQKKGNVLLKDVVEAVKTSVLRFS